jgi:hypothetical protein
VKEAMVKFIGGNLRSDVHDNTTIEQEGLPDDARTLRPDMVFEKEVREQRILEILELACPYGYISHDKDMLTTLSKKKKARCSDLANALKMLKHS